MSQFSKPTAEELYESAFSITEDVAWYVFRDDAVKQQGADWEKNYPQWCLENKGYVPVRLHNLAPNNIWSYDPGPECVRQLPALPPDLKQWQIGALNDCISYEAVCGATAALNKVKSALPQK